MTHIFSRHGRVLEAVAYIRGVEAVGGAAEVRRSAPTSGLDGASDVSDPDALYMWTRSDPLGSSGEGLRAGKMLWKLLLFVLLAEVRATYHLSPADPQRVAAQSYAQTRNSARPPLRTLNPASKIQAPRPAVAVLESLSTVY